MIKEKDWIWRGFPGHCIRAGIFSFILCTDIGKYRILTLGAMYYDGVLYEIGPRRHYETFVFKINKRNEINLFEIEADQLLVEKNKKFSNEKWDEKARLMHMKMCYKYSKFLN